jgi:MoaA/NifB/PqqE/SkfB family radical SAM enzyme
VRNARGLEFTGWGEPFSYPRLADVIERWIALNATPQLFTFATNGSLLSREWGERLRGRIQYVTISVNAATESGYAEQMRYKNSRFTLDLITGNIHAFAGGLAGEDRKRLALHMVANALNFHEIPDFVRLAASLSVPIVTVGHFMCAKKAHLDKTLWHLKHAYNEALAEGETVGQSLGVSVRGRRFFTNESAIKGHESCLAPLECMYVEIPGSMTPCCYMGAARMGNSMTRGWSKCGFPTA